MSSYRCTDYHLTTLAVWLVHERCFASLLGLTAWRTDRVELQREAFAALVEANRASCERRYISDEAASDLDSSWDQRAAGRALTLTPVQMVKAIDCYVYQSSDALDWEKSRVREATELLWRAVLRKLPGYEEAPWGCPGERER